MKTNERGFVLVDDKLETSMPGIYALGDVKGGPAFTHISYDDFRILKTNLLDGGEASIDGRPVSYTVYTDPQLGRDIRVAKMPMSHVARGWRWTRVGA